MIALLWEFVKALPSLLEMFKVLDKRIKEAKLDRQITEDIQTISEAFGEKDATKLNSLFNDK